MVKRPDDRRREQRLVRDERPGNDDLWRQLLMGELPALKRGRRVFALLPSGPRCKLCNAPFHGVGGAALRILGRRPAPSNPRVCNHCERFAHDHLGGAEVEVTLLFADVRGSTALAEGMSASQFTALMERFFNAATEAMFTTDAIIDKLVGDEVIGLYLPAFAQAGHASAAVEGARRILRATGHGTPEGPWLPVGIGINTGPTYIGTVGRSGGYTDVAVMGDTVNVAARLASAAGAGEALITAATVDACPSPASDLEHRSLSLKGRAAPVDVAVVTA